LRAGLGDAAFAAFFAGAFGFPLDLSAGLLPKAADFFVSFFSAMD
jgi:hypothetical protein